MSQSIATQAPLTIEELAERSDLGRLLVRRGVGAGIDFTVLFLLLLVPEAILGIALYHDTLWVWIGLQVIYFPLLEGIWGRSLGKLLTDTIVVDNTGRAPGILKAGLRTVLRIVEVNPLLLCVPAVIAVTWSKRRQRIGDMLAQTYVVRVKDLKAGYPATQVASAVEDIAERSSLAQLLVRRLLGAQIDILVLFALVLVPAVMLGKALFDATIWAWLGVAIMYFPMVEGIWGRSLGKLITGTIVLDNTGRAPGMLKAALRTLLRLVEVNPFLLGGLPAGIAIAVSKRHQRVGDIAAETYVVRVKDLKRNNVAFGTTRYPVLKASACAGVLLAGILATFGLPASTRSLLRDAWQHRQDVTSCIRNGGSVTDCDPKDAASYSKRGFAYAAKGDHDHAIADYNEAIRLDPKYVNAYSNRANAYFAKGELDRAIADYDEVIGLDPNFALAYNNMGVAYGAKGDLDRAIAASSAAIRLDPKLASAYRSRGFAYLFSGAAAKAVADVNQANELDHLRAISAIWVDIIEQRDNIPSHLPQAISKIDMTAWPAPIVSMFLGQMTPAAVLAAADDPDAAKKKGKLCEVNFYSGEFVLRQGSKDEAVRLLRLAASDCPLGSLERMAAKAELKAAGVTD